jgi:outer membrane protein OmpA-like peptidoglycan-associated protein
MKIGSKFAKQPINIKIQLMKYIFIQFLVFIFFTNFAEAQSKIAQANMQDAELLFNQKKYDAAKSKVQAVLNEKSDFVAAIRMMGLIELSLGNYKSATGYYDKLFAQRPEYSRNAYYEAAEAYLKQYRYDKALDYFLLFKHAQQKDYKTEEFFAQKSYERNIDFNIANSDFSLENEVKGLQDQPQKLSGNINSEEDEFMPTLTSDDKFLIFTSLRSGNENIMIARKDKKGYWANAKSIGNAINTKRNEGMAKFTTCGRRVYFSACAWENVKGGCDVYMAEYDVANDIIDKVEPATGLNSEFWDSQPSISCDGTIMYFVSNREGGLGGTDLWKSKMGPNGIWGDPVNLGPTINTAGDEETPYIAPDGISLYFSSTGHPGLGDADLFLTFLKEDGISWSTPKNLGETINSPFREAGMVISSEGKAYFSSARGLKGSLDLYENHLQSDLKPKIDAVLLDAFIIDDVTKMPVEGATVRVRSSNKSIGNYSSDKDGRFFLCVPSGASYSFIIEKGGYESDINADYFEKTAGEFVKKIEINLVKQGAVKKSEPELEKEPIDESVLADKIDSVLVDAKYEQLLKKEAFIALRESLPKSSLRKNLSLYFDSDTMNINEIHKEAILKMIAPHKDPMKLKVQVSGFADEEGDKRYNQYISEKRAKSVNDFLILIGMPPAHIIYSGKGSVSTNNAKHQNRKVEIIITEEN